jgi:hypothetical protein
MLASDGAFRGESARASPRGPGEVTYTPSAGYSGTDSFSYHAGSANGTATAQTVSINVKPQAGGQAPTIANAGLTHRRFRVAKQATAITASKAPLGTTFRFTLSTRASLQITITHTLPGLRSGRRCLAPTRKLERAHAKRCTRTVTVGTLTRANEPPGPDNVPFTGRIGHRALTPRAYRAVLRASSANGTSRPVTLSLIVVR